MICLLLFNLLSYTSAMDPDCMHCMHYIDQCSPSCPEPTTTDCGREMMNCPGPVDFQGCAMPGTCVAVGEECPFYCPYVPPMDCGEGERTCPGPIDSKGCKTMDQCVPYGEDCPLQSPGSKDNGEMGPHNCPLYNPHTDLIKCKNFILPLVGGTGLKNVYFMHYGSVFWQAFSKNWFPVLGIWYWVTWIYQSI